MTLLVLHVFYYAAVQWKENVLAVCSLNHLELCGIWSMMCKILFISWQLRLFLSDFEMWSCCIPPYTLLFKLDPEVKVIKVPICFRSRAFPSTVCVVSLTQYCKEGDHSHTEISAACWGGEKMCSGQYGYNFWNNTLPQTASITCSSSMNSLISKPNLLKAIPSHTTHIKLYHIPSPSPGRYYNCMFIFISCCLYSLVHYICSCPKFHSRFSNMKLYVFLWFLSLPFSFLLTESWFELFWNVVIYLIIYYSGIVKQDDLICMEK